MRAAHEAAVSVEVQNVLEAIELEGLEPALVRLKVYETAYGLGIALTAEEVQWAIAQLERRMAATRA